MKDVIDMIEQLWVLVFVISRAAMLAISAAVYIPILIIATFFQHLLSAARFIYSTIDAWNPVRPHIFNLDNDPIVRLEQHGEFVEVVEERK